VTGHEAPSGAELSLPVATYAAIKVELRDGRAELSDVLAKHSLDERTWRAHERKLAIALARASREGTTELADRLQQAMVERERSGQRSPVGLPKVESDVDDYVSLRVELERTSAKRKVLEQAGLSEQQWDRVHRQWTERSRADEQLASELRRKLTRARARAGSDDET
jgi:hypothetical protein